MARQRRGRGKTIVEVMGALCVVVILQLIINHVTASGLISQFILELSVAGLLLSVLGPLVGLVLYRISSLRSLAVPTGIGIGATGLFVCTFGMVMMIDGGAYWQAAIAFLCMLLVALPLPIDLLAAILTKRLAAELLESISLAPGVLLPAETVLLKEGANYTIRLRDYHLSTSAYRACLVGHWGKSEMAREQD